jgi:hypothetical protein
MRTIGNAVSKEFPSAAAVAMGDTITFQVLYNAFCWSGKQESPGLHWLPAVLRDNVVNTQERLLGTAQFNAPKQLYYAPTTDRGGSERAANTPPVHTDGFPPHYASKHWVQKVGQTSSITSLAMHTRHHTLWTTLWRS